MCIGISQSPSVRCTHVFVQSHQNIVKNKKKQNGIGEKSVVLLYWPDFHLYKCDRTNDACVYSMRAPALQSTS